MRARDRPSIFRILIRPSGCCKSSTNDYFIGPGAPTPPLLSAQHLMRALPFRVRPSKKSFSQILRKLGFPDDERTCWRTFGLASC